MPRSVNAVASRARRKKIMKAARGYFGGRSKVYTAAKNTLEKGMKYALIHRRQKKRLFRKLWIARINAAARMEGLNYSTLIHKLAQQKVTLNRKVLADLAVNNPTAFKAVAQLAK